MDKHFSNHRLRHFTSCYIENIAAYYNGKKERKCFVNIDASQLDIIIADGSLLFSNAFNYESTEDLLYYILLALEQNNCDQQNTSLIISGEVESGSAIHQVLKTYMRNIQFAITDKRLKREGGFAKLPHHYYYNLLNRIFCV